MSGFTYTPGGEVGAKPQPGTTSLADPLRAAGVTDADVVEALKRYHLALTWKPPAGHASWCPVQVPPAWRHRAAGSTPMARAQCGCGKNRVTRAIQRLDKSRAAAAA